VTFIGRTIEGFIEYLKERKENKTKHRRQKFTSGWWNMKYNELNRRRAGNKIAKASRRKNRRLSS
jgi:hypothetical protein